MVRRPFSGHIICLFLTYNIFVSWCSIMSLAQIFSWHSNRQQVLLLEKLQFFEPSAYQWQSCSFCFESESFIKANSRPRQQRFRWQSIYHRWSTLQSRECISKHGPYSASPDTRISIVGPPASHASPI